MMAQRSLNMASGAPKTLGPSILAALSPNINLSPNMASEAISEHLISKIYLGEHAPRPPSACILTHAPSLVPPPPPPPTIISTFRHLCNWDDLSHWVNFRISQLDPATINHMPLIIIHRLHAILVMYCMYTIQM